MDCITFKGSFEVVTFIEVGTFAGEDTFIEVGTFVEEDTFIEEGTFVAKEDILGEDKACLEGSVIEEVDHKEVYCKDSYIIKGDLKI